jgi:hypothetical protein
VNFTLPWVAEGSNLWTLVVKGIGFRKKHGLDVDIARGSGSMPAAQAIRLHRLASEGGTESSNPLSSSSQSVSAVNRRPLPEEPRGFAALGACTGT